jgi:hypothetical protein
MNRWNYCATAQPLFLRALRERLYSYFFDETHY